MKALLQKSCTTCTKSSVQTYYYNIKALAKMAGYDEPPKHGRWINKALLAKIRKLPLMKFKNMTIADESHQRGRFKEERHMGNGDVERDGPVQQTT